MNAATLPAALRPSQPDQLVRLGPSLDGGYLVHSDDVMAADGLISLGIDRDWRFEKEFLQKNPVPLHAYDGCTSVAYLLGDIPRAARDRNIRWACRTLIRTMDYVHFFTGSTRHYRSFVSTAQYAYEETAAEVIPFHQVFENMTAAGSRKPFLKVDIEGAEYQILDDILARAGQTAGLAIEFHDCDIRMSQVSDFVQRYPYSLVHIHANPFGGFGRLGIPKALELTFSPSSVGGGGSLRLPHPLDCPNDGTADTPLLFA